MSSSYQGHHLKKKTMMGRSPQCYIPSFVEIGQSVPEKKSFEDLPYMGMAGILVMLPASYQQIFISTYLKAYIQTLVEIGPVVSEKKQVLIFIHKRPWAKVKT